MKMKTLTATIFACILITSVQSNAQDVKPTTSSSEDLAKQLANPVASLISVPFQNNTDVGIGAFNGYRNTMNFQPVIPVSLSKKVNLITRVVLPIVTQQNITGLNNKESGLSDALLSAMFSPAAPKNGLVWGAGPAILMPTATNDFLGFEKWGAGPQGLLLMQTKGWTFGTLANQIWSFAGNDVRADISQLYVQPFLSYNFKSGAGLNAAAEITQNWTSDATSVFFIPTVSGITKLGKQTISIVVGPRIPISVPSGSRPDFGVRAGLTFVFPK